MATNGKLGYMLLGAGAAAWWLSKEQNREKFDQWMSKAKDMNIGGQNVGDMMSKAKDMNMGDMVSKAKNMMGKNSGSSTENFPVHKSGRPDPYDTADNKMVDEGSQYGVKYFNDNVQ